MDNTLKDPTDVLDTPAKPASRVMQIFKSSIGTVNYPFGSSSIAGKIAHFINGEFMTDVPAEIAELNLEIERGHPHFYRDKKKLEIDILADPLQSVKDKAIADYIRGQEKAREAAKNKDHGQIEDAKAGENTGIGTSFNAGTNLVDKPNVTNSFTDPNSAVSPGNASVDNNNPDPAKGAETSMSSEAGGANVGINTTGATAARLNDALAKAKKS